MAIGYACITIGVQNAKLSRCLIKNATDDNIRKIAALNLSALEAMVDYNIKKEIKLFRISSDIIPFASHPVNTLRWADEFKDVFTRIGQKILEASMRVSMHPGQYTVLNSPDPRVVRNAIEDLKYHAAFLDALGVDRTNKIILHIGGVYRDKHKAIQTFIENYHQLSEDVKSRLVIENDDKNYTVQDTLEISKIIGIPVVLDNLHHELNPPNKNLPEFEWIQLCGNTFDKQDGKQKIHYSQQRTGDVRGAHSETIYIGEFLQFYNRLPDKEIDIMLEVKDKNLSAVKCINSINKDLCIRELEEEWARYKYFVLSRSAKLYNEMRELLKEKQAPKAEVFYQKIEQAILLPEDQGAEVNAAQHVWGYVKKECSSIEKRRFEKLLEDYMEGTVKSQLLKNHLFRCAQKQGIEYLINSLLYWGQA
ncbi:UV DNA damage repair endonuclease UvsE [Petroclostridium sp. X23]|uniref:UV DNA damage repair endonuclease UvsE n=1 Tax=Petroclostridium sp. X23 TaxID=3045146 RepID=UPI0024ACC3B5|nr:UV DNA damage repair endonuclease UvsE [Petroclostridium sp. X23]WHH57676.1 UV DNA damage repair endonuclease UvsE [Petroclostridium sp. X23]